MPHLFTTAAGAACLAAAAGGGTIEFLDQTFDPADYTIEFTEGPDGQTASQEPDGGASGGAPDPFRRVTTVTNATTITAHLHNAFVIDPAATSVESLQLSIDVKAIHAFGQGMAYGFAIKQEDTLLVLGGAITGSDAPAFQWRTFSDEPTAQELSQIDFSPNGAPIQFGFRTSNSGGAGIAIGFDNLHVTITTASCPEDLDGDGVVGFSDLNIVLADFNTTGPGLPGDVDGDGDVDFNDLNLIVSVFNTEC